MTEQELLSAFVWQMLPIMIGGFTFFAIVAGGTYLGRVWFDRTSYVPTPKVEQYLAAMEEADRAALKLEKTPRK